MRVRKLVAVAGVVVLVALISAPAAAASATSVAVAVPAVDDWVVAPGGSTSKFREFMLNITGSVLKGFTPDKWQREMSANANRYNLGGETLNHAYGFDSTGGWANTPPETPAEYAMKRAEFEKSASFTKPDGTKVKGSKPLMSVPFTQNERLNKNVGSGLAAVTAGAIGWAGGVAAGKFISNAMGIDSQRGLCYPTFEDFGIIGAITGADCSSLFAFDAEYAPNSDVVEGYSNMLPFCGTLANGKEACMVMLGTVTTQYPSYALRSACFSFTIDGVGQSAAIFGSTSPRVYEHFGTASGLAPSGGGSGYECRAQFGANALATSLDHSLVPPARGPVVSYYLTTNPDWYSTTRLPWGSNPPVVPLYTDDLDPERTLICTITGTDGITYTQESAPYHESNGTVAAPECPQLPDGVAPVGVAIDQDTNGLIERVQDLDVTDEFVDWWNAYPECRTGGCKLDLIKGGTGIVAASCFDVGEACADWFEDPARADIYKCRYGVHDVAIEECFVYSGTFKPGRIEIGAPYSDPLTGDWSGGENAPSPDRQALGQGVQDPALARSCNGMASAGFDPVAWVMRPIQCALEWAFVPRPMQVELQFAAAKLAWSDTPLMQLLDGWNEINELSFGPSGCQGPHFDFTGTMLGDLGYPLDACSGPKAQAASMVSLMILVSAGIGCLVSVTASIAGVVGMSKPEV